MQLTRNVFKYLENFSIDFFKLDNFDEDTANRFINYTPIIDYIVRSDNDCSFAFTNVSINTPLIFNLKHSANLSDRKTIEIDVYSEYDIDREAVTLDICSGVDGNAIRGSFKNINKLDSGNLTTLIFDLGNINNSRLRQYSSIKSIRLNIDSDAFFICGIGAYNGEYIVTHDDLVSLIHSSISYVKNKLNSDTIPYNIGIYEAIYKLTAYYIWQRESTTPRNTKKNYDYLKNEANELIKYYLTKGYHPALEPFTDSVTKKGRRVIEGDNIDSEKDKQLIEILMKENKEMKDFINELDDLV